MAAGKAAEENLLMVGGVDNDDNDAEILPHPSRKAALEAAATLERYVSVLEESSGYARKLENLLMSFGRQTHFEETQSMPIFVRIGAHAVTFSGLPVRIVDLAFWVLWSIFVRIGTKHFGQNLIFLSG